jgi:hypothetical protein
MKPHEQRLWDQGLRRLIYNEQGSGLDLIQMRQQQKTTLVLLLRKAWD